MMKKLIVIALLGVMLAGCTSKTSHGDCVGAFDDKNPNKVYKASGWNIFLAVFFSELIVPPVLVVMNETFCPVGEK